MASILVPENTESENSIWQATAQQVMAGVISYINESVYYQGRRNLGEVNSFFNSGVNLQALMALIKEQERYPLQVHGGELQCLHRAIRARGRVGAARHPEGVTTLPQ